MKAVTSAPVQLTSGLVFLLASAVGLIAANLYYAQPLVSLIASSLDLEPASAGLVVTLTQVGYGVGVLFVVPLGDLIENKKLILCLLVLTILSLISLSFVHQLTPYFASAFSLGVGACCLQIVILYGAQMSTDANRGQVVGSIMSGLMVGIMLSRPVASFITSVSSWNTVFLVSSGMMILVGFALYINLPKRHPVSAQMSYGRLMASMLQLILRTPVLRRRAVYQGCLFSAFCLFWTATPLYLSGPNFQLSQNGIALFALAGIAGAVSAPSAGRFADRGWTKVGTFIAMMSVVVAFLATEIFVQGGTASLVVLVLAAILLDAGVTANLVLGQRAIFALPSKYRSRLNGIFIAILFVGGALGSYLGAWSYAKGGWALTAWVGVLMPITALLYFATEWMTGFHKKGYRLRKASAPQT